jgi:hypothetical protein
VIKIKNLLITIINVINLKPQTDITEYLHRLEENNHFKLKSQLSDFNLTSEIESNKLELLEILKDFSEDLIYLDMHKNRRLEYRLFGLEEYIKASENILKIISNRLLQLFVLCIFSALITTLGFSIFIPRHESYVLLFGPFLFYIFSLLLLFCICLFVCLYVYWLDRIFNYKSTSFTLNRLSRNDCIYWDVYIERICKIPKILIKDVDSILSYELKKVEREFDASLELVYVVAAVAGFITFLVSSRMGIINQATLALIGLGVLIAMISSLYRYLSRKSKNFRINCLEQLLLLLRLAQNKLE